MKMYWKKANKGRHIEEREIKRKEEHHMKMYWTKTNKEKRIEERKNKGKRTRLSRYEKYKKETKGRLM